MYPKSKNTFSSPREWVLYDGQCGLCTAWAARLGPWLQTHGFDLAPLQTDWVQKRLNLPQEHLLDEMRVITKTNEVVGGGDALLYIMKTAWWGGPLYVLAYLPGVKPLIRMAYQAFAKRRHCLSGTCSPKGIH